MWGPRNAYARTSAARGSPIEGWRSVSGAGAIAEHIRSPFQPDVSDAVREGLENATTAAVEAEDWEGPAFQAGMNAAVVCRAFETSRRREVLSFTLDRPDIAADVGVSSSAKQAADPSMAPLGSSGPGVKPIHACPASQIKPLSKEFQMRFLC
jgi:hypothetical protein